MADTSSINDFYSSTDHMNTSDHTTLRFSVEAAGHLINNIKSIENHNNYCTSNSSTNVGGFMNNSINYNEEDEDEDDYENRYGSRNNNYSMIFDTHSTRGYNTCMNSYHNNNYQLVENSQQQHQHHVNQNKKNKNNNSNNIADSSIGSSTGQQVSGKRKRKRILNRLQRAEATMREKRRMLKLNKAFEDLRKVLPISEFAKNKLSRAETLKSAIEYIEKMTELLLL